MSSHENKIWQEQVEQTHIVGLSGRIDQLVTPTLDTTLTQLIGIDSGRLLIDLTAVDYINSGGLRCLVSAWRQARRHGGDVALYGLSARLKELFETMGFDNVFKIYANKESALHPELTS